MTDRRLTSEEKTMLRELLDAVAVPGPQARVYVSLREKLLGENAWAETENRRAEP